MDLIKLDDEFKKKILIGRNNIKNNFGSRELEIGKRLSNTRFKGQDNN